MVVFFGQFLLIMFVIGYYDLLRASKINSELLFKGFIDASIFIAISASIIGILEVILFYLIGSTFGIFHPEEMGFPRAMSLFSEPDWFGYYLASVALMVFWLRDYIRHNRFINSVILLGLFSSGTRAALFGLFLVLGIALLLNIKGIKKVRMISVSLVSIALATIIFSIVVPKKMFNRFNPVTMTSTDGGAFDSRLFSMIMTLDYISKRPWLGNGAGGLGMLTEDDENNEIYASGGKMNTGRGGANLILTSLFDVGIIGTIPLFIFIIITIKKIIIYFNSLSNKIYNEAKLLALSSVLLLTFIEVMLNNMIRYSYIWLVFAFFFYYVYKYKELKKYV
jgi:hypothetical protein